jgi:hypothetical protein
VQTNSGPQQHGYVRVAENRSDVWLDPQAILDDFVVRQSVPEPLKRDAQFGTRVVRSDAAMHAGPERQMPVGRPVDVDVVGVVELGLVSVRRSEKKQDSLPRLDCLTAN